LAEDAGTEKDLLYQTYFNNRSAGFFIRMGSRYGLYDTIGILIRSNVAYNKLLESINAPGVEAGFNSPEYRANLSVGHHAIIPNLGFNVNFHCKAAFCGSSFGAADIPAFSTLDAHISYKVSKIKTVFKLGAIEYSEQLLHNQFRKCINRGLYYISLVYEDIMEYTKRDKN